MALVLIPDYPHYQIIAGARALTRSGDICDSAWKINRVERTLKSNAIRHIHTITSAEQDAHLYCRDVIQLCEQYHYDMILPFGDSAYYAVVTHGAELSKVTRLLVPGLDAFFIAHDKQKTVDFCRKIGVPVPQSFANYSDEDIPAIANAIRYPAVVKARSGTGVEKGLRYANHKQELIRMVGEISSFQSNKDGIEYQSPIIQEYIPGFIHDACILAQDGKLVQALTQVRKLMYPIYGGVGAINVTTHNPILVNQARKLVETLGWNGPAQIEFKFDPRDQTYKLIEINPKLWGTLDLSIKVGVNFPKMIRDILLGEKVETERSYPENVRGIFVFHQAMYSAVQLIREFGLSALQDPTSYQKTYLDIDFTDFNYEMLKILQAFYKALRGKINYNNANLEKKYINTLSSPLSAMV